jgi:hypothetical protein
MPRNQYLNLKCGVSVIRVEIRFLVNLERLIVSERHDLAVLGEGPHPANPKVIGLRCWRGAIAMVRQGVGFQLAKKVQTGNRQMEKWAD